ncbi:hypothetical protein [Acutalibacter intestini]|uniref:hypothetical protein n=1 Tax=Acutalibacter intestini TaxID=3093659 RepID=UPI002AC935B5|nr:hypothetical protein [Acutalibacter sp. M00204]
MSDKKKAHPGAGTPGQAKETASFQGSAISTKDCTTKAAGVQVTISAFLHVGKKEIEREAGIIEGEYHGRQDNS